MSTKKSVKELLDNRELFFIMGPCVIESEETTFRIASALKDICERQQVNLIFKASFDKANRTSVKSYRGPGLEEGLRILGNIKKELDLPVISDIHEAHQAEKVADVLSAVQIPAFLARQTDLLMEAGKTGLPVNIKKAQFMAAEDMLHAAEKVKAGGGDSIAFTERGTTFGYRNLVVDFRNIQIMKEAGYPVVIDATHSVQRPSAEGGGSGGNPEFIPLMASAGVVSGASGVFMEVHPEPEKALSDGTNSMNIKMVEPLLIRLKKLYNIDL